MVDWRQIQGRIRKAKAAPDAPAQLAALYERTRDAMVAFELAAFHEKAGEHAEAARWYTTAAGRFRRAQWKRKAEEALARLGAPAASGTLPAAEGTLARPEEFPETAVPATHDFFPSAERVQEEPLPAGAPAESAKGETSASPESVQAKRRRRGRRGGRRHRRRPEGEPRVSVPVPAKREAAERAPARERPPVAPPRELPWFEPEREIEREEEREQEPVSRRAEEVPSPVGGWPGRGRAGEPALASRMARLESDLRRLLAAPLNRLAQAEEAPAGPGVFIVSDEDLTSNYYVEACQTLRIGIGILLRGERASRRPGPPLKGRLADHLGITEARVPKYLKEHCVVRWLQLDEGAPHLAHFAIAILRPALNE